MDTSCLAGCIMEKDVVLCDGGDFTVGNNQNTHSDLECAKLCWDSSGCVAVTRHQVRMACHDVTYCHKCHIM